MFISKLDLERLEEKLRKEFDGKIVEINALLEELKPKTRQNSKKVVE
tara:strand:+ start:715 stop:855 length:141 start_codon:yes stop_codon:yes gene_type:complete